MSITAVRVCRPSATRPRLDLCGFARTGLAVDAGGTVFVADSGNQTIRKITAAGVVTTLAGSPGMAGSIDWLGNVARFFAPIGIALDAAGILHAASLDNTIRAVNPMGLVSTEAGTAAIAHGGSADGTGASAGFNNPYGIAADASGNLYVADLGNATLRKIAPGSVVSTVAGQAPAPGSTDGIGGAVRFSSPQGIAADGAGNVYVADFGNATIRKVTAAGVASTVAGIAGLQGYVDGAGNVARFSNAAGIASDMAGNLYVADTDNQLIRKISTSGVVTTFAGTAGVPGYADGTGTAAMFNQPVGLSIDPAGNVYVADQYNFVIRKITPAGVVSTLAGSGVQGSLDATGTAAQFNNPSSTTVDAAGNVYVTDLGNYAIRMITPAGVVTTLAGQVGQPGSNDGAMASFNLPVSICADPSGVFYVADSGNHTVRRITASGVVTTVLGVAGQEGTRLGSDARLSGPAGLACLGGNRVAISSGNAVLVVTLP